MVDEDDHVIGVISEADLIRRDEIGTDTYHLWWLEALPARALLEAMVEAKSRHQQYRERVTMRIDESSLDPS